MDKLQSEAILKNWEDREQIAQSMIPLIGDLYRKFGVIPQLFKNSLAGNSAREIIGAHDKTQSIATPALRESETIDVLRVLNDLHVSAGPINAGSIDVGRIAIEFRSVKSTLNLQQYIEAQQEKYFSYLPAQPCQDVVLYGFGRIGRIITRLLTSQKIGKALRLRAIVVRGKGSKNDLHKRCELLKFDSIHGPFDGTVEIDEKNNTLIINGYAVKVIVAQSPAEAIYNGLELSDVFTIDSTGAWRDQQGLEQHLAQPCFKKVLLTAPGKGNMKNIVYGINDNTISDQDNIVSAASCTTNAIAPILKVIMDQYGIVKGHIESIHSYTNDQNLIDNYHSKSRRGRSATQNLVLTETGAASAIGKVLPPLEGLLSASSIRVPVPNVSLAIINLDLGKKTTRDELNEYVRDIALHSVLREQIDYSDGTSVVSSDLVGSSYACVFDSKATVVDGHRCVLYCWYDNECGYSHQVIRCLLKMAAIERYPEALS